MNEAHVLRTLGPRLLQQQRFRHCGIASVIVVLLVWDSNGFVFAQSLDMRELLEKHELNRCGPYALQSCANYLGLPVRQRDLRKGLPNGEVTTFNQLAGLAKKQGLFAAPIRWNADSIVLSGAPAILATKQKGVSHFVAALAIQGDNVYIVDLPHAGWMRLQVLCEKLQWKGEALHIATSNLPILWLYVLLYYKRILLGAVAIVGLLFAIRRVRARTGGKRVGCCQPCRIVIVFMCATCASINSGCNRNGSGASNHLARVEPEQVTIDLSKQANPENVEFETVLSIVNDGQSAIRIRAIVSSCSCAVVNGPSKKILKPGETARIPLRIAPPRHGEKHSQVKILVEAGSVQQRLVARILMRGLPLQSPAVINSPGEVLLRRDAEGDATAIMRVRTYEKRKSQPWIERATVQPPIVAVKYLGVKETDSPEQGIVVRTYSYSLKAQQVAESSNDHVLSTARITLERADSDVPVVKVFVRLKKWQPYRLVPKVVFVDMLADMPCRLEREVRIVFSDKRFRPAEIKGWATADWISVKAVMLKKSVDPCEAVITLRLLRKRMGSIGTIRANLVVKVLGEKGNTAEETIPICVKMRPPT